MKQTALTAIFLIFVGWLTCTQPVTEKEYDNPYDKYSSKYNPIIVNPARIALSENGGTGSFSVVLNLQPDDDVVIDIESKDPSEVTVDKSYLVFTSQNWNIEQIVNLTGVGDTAVDSDQETIIQLTINALLTKETAVGYSLINPDDVNVTVLDDDDDIGDIGPAGGYIFYDKGSYSNGWRYLEAAPTNQSSSAEWGCFDWADSIAIPGADGTAMGTGKQNTIDIVNGCGEAGTPARICYDLSLGGYSDWFLPSRDELNLMYINLKQQGVGGFSGGYWSSSEYNLYNAWYQNFTTGNQGPVGKSNLNYIRAARAF